MVLYLDRLSLRIPGISAADGRRLAHLVADYLADEELPGAARTIDRLRVSVAHRPAEPLELTASRIAAELRRALARSP